MLALLAQTQLAMLLMRFAPAVANAFWRAVMTRSPSSRLLASIRCKRRRRKNADPSIPIAPAWRWVNARPFSRWKNSGPRADVARRYLGQSLVTEFPPTIII